MLIAPMLDDDKKIVLLEISHGAIVPRKYVKLGGGKWN